MKKNKIKKLLLIITFFTIFHVANVFAGNAIAGVTNNGSQNCSIMYNGKCHMSYNITVSYNGNNYSGHCVDFGQKLRGISYQESFSCQEINDPGLTYILNSGNSNDIITAAVRAYKVGLSVSGSSASAVNSLVSEAKKYTGGSAGSLTFMKSGGSEGTVTYNVTSPVAIPNVEFTCKSGCTVNSSSWEGKSGKVSVTATGTCEFVINATYTGSGSETTYVGNSKVLMCTRAARQRVVFTISESNSSSSGGSEETPATGKVTQSFTGKIDKSTGGSYYKNYCDDGDTCSSDCKTNINIPPYCDEGMNDASITGPEDIKCCVLHGNDDAGSPYQAKVPLENGNIISEDNPYCAVYCKEDYKMKLPGIQRVNSGRYFTLEKTVVTAERTCYATYGTSPSKDAKSTKSIDIYKFVNEIKQAQKNVIEAYNKYEIARAKWDSVNDARHDTTSTTCTEYACTGASAYDEKTCIDNKGTWGTSCSNTIYNDAWYGNSKSYKIVKYTVDDKTGKVTITGYGTGSTSANYGVTRSCGANCGANETNVGEHRDKNEYQTDMNNAAKAITEAVNKLKEKIGYMQECYSWVNNLCLDPEVLFDYEEDYPINYEKVGGTGPTSEAPTYSDQKDIDNAYTTNGSGSLEDVNYAFCNTAGCNNSNAETLAKQISTLSSHLYYRKIFASGSAEYANTQEFYVKYPDGSVDTSKLTSNYNPIGQVYPVALKRPTGLYKWTLNFSKMGQFNEFVGKCGKDTGMLGRFDKIFATKADLEYICGYITDCDDCDYKCIGDGCFIPDDPKCPECDVYCINCVFDGDEDTYFYRTISLNEFNPNNRTLGANWTNEKGKQTREEIERGPNNNGVAEEIYDEVQYSYKITPTQMKSIRDYNMQTGTYVADDLDFKNKGEVKLAYGHSNFLRKTGSKYFTELKRNDDWVLWSDMAVDGMGPAWK